MRGTCKEGHFKVGENDVLALLELASVDQWQYLLDLEIWKGDRIEISHTSHWLSLLQQANCGQLVKWLFNEGEYLVYYHLFRIIDVVVINKGDDAYDLPEGFFTLDGVIHIRVKELEFKESIENIIRVMASEDFQKYQGLFLACKPDYRCGYDNAKRAWGFGQVMYKSCQISQSSY